MSGSRRLGLAPAAAIGLAGFLVLEGSAGAIRALLHLEPGHAIAMANCQFDQELGWETLEDALTEDHHGAGSHVSTGEDGQRLFEGGQESAEDGRFRICFLGDSFTFGYGVADDETIAARIQQSDPRIATMNLAVNGYGLDQCWLRWKRIQENWGCDIVALGLIAHDLYRMELRVFSGLEKPTLKLDGETLVGPERPLVDRTGLPMKGASIRFLDQLSIGRSANAMMERLGLRLAPANVPEQPSATGQLPASAEVARRVLRDFRATSEVRGQIFVLFYMPRGSQLASEPTVAAAWLKAVAQEERIPFCDLTPSFKALDAEALELHFRRDTHFTARGQALASESLLSELRRLVPGFPK